MNPMRPMMVIGDMAEKSLDAMRIRLPAVLAELDAPAPLPWRFLPRAWSVSVIPSPDGRGDLTMRMRHGTASHFVHYEPTRMAYVSVQIPTAQAPIMIMLRSRHCNLLDPSIMPDPANPIAAMRRVIRIAECAVSRANMDAAAIDEIMPAAIRGVLEAHGGGVRNRARLPSPIVSAAASCCFGDEGISVDAPAVPDFVSLEILGDLWMRTVIVLEPIERDGGDEPVIDVMRSAGRMAEFMTDHA